jgi:hypothetical protein
MSLKDEAQDRLAAFNVEPLSVWTHYKGGKYVVITTAIMEDTLQPMVVYRSNAKKTNSIRTLANFLEMVETKEELFGSGLVPRFERVEE